VVAARCTGEPAHDIDDLNHRIAALDAEIADLLADYSNPLEDLQGAAATSPQPSSPTPATCAASATPVRSLGSAAPRRSSGGSGQISGRRRLHRGGNANATSRSIPSPSSSNATISKPRCRG
jgi:hypothetical protein